MIRYLRELTGETDGRWYNPNLEELLVGWLINAAITEKILYKPLSPPCGAQLSKTAHNYPWSDVVIGISYVQKDRQRVLL